MNLQDVAKIAMLEDIKDLQDYTDAIMDKEIVMLAQNTEYLKLQENRKNMQLEKITNVEEKTMTCNGYNLYTDMLSKIMKMMNTMPEDTTIT